MLPAGTLIDRVRLTTPPGIPAADQAAVRRRVAAALQHIDIAPRGMPPRAILVLRRLDDPQPGGLWQGPPWRAGQRWGRQARSVVEQCWRTASRPFHGPVPPEALAVWFADPAEWLACLSLDLAAGIARQRWWWQALLPAAPSLADLWCAQARWLPAALNLLAERSPAQVAELVSMLAPDQLRAVRRELVAVYRLPPALAEAPLAPARAGQALPAPLRQRTGIAADVLRLALVLARAPARVGQLLADDPPAASVPERAPAAIRHLARRTDVEQGAAGTQTPSQNDSHPVEPVASCTPSAPALLQPIDPAVPAGAAGAPADASAEPLPAIDRRPDRAGAHLLPPRARLEQIHAVPRSLEPAASGSAPEPALPLVLERGVRTNLGGTWYLVNLLDELGLFARATHPWLVLKATAVLLLAGSEGIRSLPEPFDPLWAALNELADVADRDQLWPACLALATAHLAELYERFAGAAIVAERVAGLLRQPALLYVTRTHIDVTFSLEQIDRDLRVAGFDRDPGWVPALARVISFHYE